MAARERYRQCQQERDMGHVSMKEIQAMSVREREIQDMSA